MEIKTAYTRLRREVEKTVGRTMESPSDFSILSRDIRKRTHDTVSATTLKRFYGYVRGGGVPRTSTLSILSRYVGYEGWNSFLNSDGVESCFLSDYVIRSEGMLEGDMVRFGWNPDRMCVVRYKGGNLYEVIYVENGCFGVGDFFEVDFFALHQPLYLHNVHLKSAMGGVGGTYVVGYKSGLTSLELQKKG